jgi:small subunit ribosomal protein S16
MVRIRLTRVGAKKQPHYRVVVADQRSPRDGRFIEIIGNYNPRTEPPTMVIDQERALYWLRRGAQPSEAVQRILDKTGVTDILAGVVPAEAEEDVPAAEVVVESAQAEESPAQES